MVSFRLVHATQKQRRRFVRGEHAFGDDQRIATPSGDGPYRPDHVAQMDQDLADDDDIKEPKRVRKVVGVAVVDAGARPELAVGKPVGSLDAVEVVCNACVPCRPVDEREVLREGQPLPA